MSGFMDTHMIPAKIYKKIVELVPIVCVDIILTFKGKYVLVKRATEPLKGEWWVVGGRAYKGEPTVETAKRKVREELGMEAKGFKKVAVYEDHYPKSSWGVPTSSVSVVYRATLTKYDPKPDKTISEVKLSDKLPARFLKNLS